MTVEEANKWLDRVNNALHNLYSIQVKCDKESEIWEQFAESCNLNVGSGEFTYVIIEALCSYKNMMKEKINKTKIDWSEE